jgi:hypothetical protein
VRRELKQKTKAWLCSEILPVLGETEATLRGKLELGHVKLEETYAGEATEVSLWDIARLHIAQRLRQLNFESERAFALAELLVALAYKDLMTGSEVFSAVAGQLQEITYVLSLRAQPIPVGVRIITVLPDAPQRGLIELALGASDPQNVIVPVHALVLDVWRRLPNLPLEIAEWVLASKRKLGTVESRSGKNGPLIYIYIQDNQAADREA